MSPETLTKSTIPQYTRNSSEKSQDFVYNRDIQDSFPLPLAPNGDHTAENLRYRHTVLSELANHDDMQNVTNNYYKCHHPDFFGYMTCPAHPEEQAFARPHSCNEVLICKECAKKHHTREAARWGKSIQKHATQLSPYHKPYHVTLTTPYQLGSGDDAAHVRQILIDTSSVFRRYFRSLAKVARWYYAAEELKKTNCWTRSIRARYNALCCDKYAVALWDDLRSIKPPFWWRQMRNKLADGKTLKELGVGVLYASEFGETGHRLHSHAYYHGNPINYEVFQNLWSDLTDGIFVDIDPIKSINGGVMEVTKYATKLTKVDVNLLPTLYRAFHGQRRIRAIGSFHGLISEYASPVEHLFCGECGMQLCWLSEGAYQHLISLTIGANSNNSDDGFYDANAPPLPKQLPLFLKPSESINHYDV